MHDNKSETEELRALDDYQDRLFLPCVKFNFIIVASSLCFVDDNIARVIRKYGFLCEKDLTITGAFQLETFHNYDIDYTNQMFCNP